MSAESKVETARELAKAMHHEIFNLSSERLDRLSLEIANEGRIKRRVKTASLESLKVAVNGQADIGVSALRMLCKPLSA